MTCALFQWPANTCLIRELAAELMRRDRDTLAASLVILPTKRLGNWLLALIARRHGAFVPPKILTFEEMIERYAPSPSTVSERVVTTLEEKQLLTQLIESKRFRHLRPGHEHELLQLFHEFVDWDIETCAHERLRAAAEIGARSEEGLNTLLERMDEIEVLRQERLAALSKARAIPANVLAARRYRSLALAMMQHVRIPGLDSNIYLVGLSSAKLMSAPLFRALSQCPNVEIWITEPPPLRRGPIERLIEYCDVTPRPRVATVVEKPIIYAHTAESPLAETAIAVAIVEDAIARGCLPSHIAILVANDHTYAAPLRQTLRRAKITANFAITSPLARTRAGSWIAALTHVLAGNQDATAQLGLLTHSVTRNWLRKTIATAAIVPDMVFDAELTHQICQGPLKLIDQNFDFSAEPSAETTSLYYSSIVALHGLLSAILKPARRTLANHASEWQTVFINIGLIGSAAPQEIDEGVGQSVQAGLIKFFSDLQAADPSLTGELTPRRFLGIIEEELLQSDVRSVGDQLAGVQVLSIEEARYVPFRLAIVLGCNEGRLPRALPKDRLVDNYLKTRIGLPGWQLLEAIEDTTFQLLVARIPQLHLTYAIRDGKDELVRSRFVETFLAEKRAILAPACEASILRRLIDGEDSDTAQRPQLAVDGDEGRVSGSTDDLRHYLTKLSATSLEALLLCPYRFLLRRLNVQSVELPEKSAGREEGERLHVILEEFFTCRDSEITPLPCAEDWLAFEAVVVRRLLELTLRNFPAGFNQQPLYRHLRGFAWPAFAQHLKRIHTPDTWQTMRIAPLRELRFGDRGGLAGAEITINGRSVALTGAIDAVDPAEGLTLISDYKTRGIPDRKLMTQGLAPQLPLYASVLESAGSALTGNEYQMASTVVGYWSIIRGEWQGLAAGKDVLKEAKAKKLIGSRTQSTLEELVEQLRSHWQWRDHSILERDRAFRADPTACGFCSYQGICRRDDPRWAEVMKTRLELKARLLPQAAYPEDANHE